MCSRMDTQYFEFTLYSVMGDNKDTKLHFSYLCIKDTSRENIRNQVFIWKHLHSPRINMYCVLKNLPRLLYVQTSITFK